MQQHQHAAEEEGQAELDQPDGPPGHHMHVQLDQGVPDGLADTDVDLVLVDWQPHIIEDEDDPVVDQLNGKEDETGQEGIQSQTFEADHVDRWVSVDHLLGLAYFLNHFRADFLPTVYPGDSVQDT